MKKKLIAGLLTGIFVVSGSVMAFAHGDYEGITTFGIAGGNQDGTISTWPPDFSGLPGFGPGGIFRPDFPVLG